MKEEELLMYEAPSITEYISIPWMQNIVARYIVWKVNRKMRRFKERNLRAKFINESRNKSDL